MDAIETVEFTGTLAGWIGGGTCAVAEGFAPAGPFPDGPQPPPPKPAQAGTPALFPASPEPPAQVKMGCGEPDCESGSRSGRPETESGPTRKGGKRPRYTERQQGLRSLSVREFARDHYIAARALGPSDIENVNALLSHLGRCRGQTLVRELSDELLYEVRDYFLVLIADRECGPANANKNLRYLRAIANYAARERLLKARLTFSAFLPVPKPRPKALTEGECAKIGQAARAVTGFVGEKKRDGYAIPAGVWWYAWYQVMSRVGNRITALMKAPRGDYLSGQVVTIDGRKMIGGVIWLREENQKQKADQRLAVPDYVAAAVEDLLQAHDEPLLFPWPHDKRREDQKPNWKTLYAHFRKKILAPAGVSTPKGVVTRVFRRTAGTWVEKLGGSGRRHLGHSSDSVFKTFYQDPSQGPVTTDACLIPEDKAPAPLGQLTLFVKDAK